MRNKYIFTSERLGFRTWTLADVDALHEINSNVAVMRYFPATQSKQQSLDFIKRMQNQYRKRKHCYFAVEKKENQEFIGFIGLSYQTYEADFNPATDIGWRIHPKHWKKGYATEGAKECLRYAFNCLSLNQIVAVAPAINVPSIQVMEKIGMTRERTFKHELLHQYPELQDCVLYKVNRPKQLV